MAHRFFVLSTSISGDRVRFNAVQAHQLRNVLRLSPGARVIVLDNSGLEYEVELVALKRDAAEGRIHAQHPSNAEPLVALTLYQSPIKGDRFEWVLQKGTELGVSAFVPLICQRTIARDPGRLEKKRPRWERIVREAAEQSGRGRLPRLLAPVLFPDACRRSVPGTGLRLLLWTGESGPGLAAAAARTPDIDEVSLLVGPEGGFTPDEISLAGDCGIQSVSLGPRTLRAETAGIAASAIVLSVLGEMG